MELLARPGSPHPARKPGGMIYTAAGTCYPAFLAVFPKISTFPACLLLLLVLYDFYLV